jgi:Uma2 family endonuclease
MATVITAPAEQLPDFLSDPEALYEIVNGEYREAPHMGAYSTLLATALCGYLWVYATQRKLGLPAIETLFRLSPEGPSRRPDVAFVAFDRFQRVPEPTEQLSQWEAVPNLAVEIISRTNQSDDVEAKLEDYFRAGVQLVWVIYPRFRRIYVYESLTHVKVLLENEDLVGDPALPGFRLPVRELFGALVKPQ